MFAVMMDWQEVDIDHWTFLWEITKTVPLGMEVPVSGYIS